MQEHFISLFKAFRMSLYILSFGIGFLDIFYLHYLIKGKKQGKSLEEYVGRFFSKKKVVIICEIIMVFGIMSSPMIFSNFENTDIGSFLEKNSYNESYYIYIRETDKSKVYKLKADIIRAQYGYSTFGGNDEAFAPQGRGYFVEKVYWGNGGYLSFAEEDDIDGVVSAQIYPNEEAKVIDCHGEEYYITLTHEKVN